MDSSGIIARLLTAGGVALLILAGVLAYPYVHSRLASPPTLTVVTPSSQPPREVIGDSNKPQATQMMPTEAPILTPDPSPTPSPVIVSALIPTATPNSLERESQQPNAAPPTRIVIPTLGVDGPVVAVSLDTTEVEGQVQPAWGVPDGYAAGWHETSATLGERGNLVLNGHNTSNGEIFRDLYTLHPDDEIIVYSEAISRTYAVSETLILPEGGQPLEVRLANARYVMPTDDERLTLVTCHPYGSLRNRLIVIAKPRGFDRSSEPLED
jgi:LPXTG-site transpeptidase (sortase) family protein